MSFIVQVLFKVSEATQATAPSTRQLYVFNILHMGEHPVWLIVPQPGCKGGLERDSKGETSLNCICLHKNLFLGSAHNRIRDATGVS